MLAGNPAYFFERLIQDYGDFVHYRGLLSFYQVNHPSLVKSVLMGTHAFVPFGGGPRICIGINFAVMELLVTVATIAQKYRVRVAQEHRHDMIAKMTMSPKYGMKVFWERR